MPAKEKTNLPEFKSKSLIKLPKRIPLTNFLEGDFGKAVLEEYNGRVEKDYDKSILRVLSYKDDVVKGSNPFAVVLVNKIISQEGLKTADPKDLELILRTYALDLNLNLLGKYINSALVLRSEDNPNKYLAIDLAKQIKVMNKHIEYPIMIPLASLDLVKDDNNNYGLSFKLKENAELVYAPILNETGTFNSEDIDEEIGLPKKLSGGERYLRSRKDGLSKLNIDGFLSLNSEYYDLDFSASDGRIVVISGNAIKQNYEAEILK